LNHSVHGCFNRSR